jgi:hypothetical protein
MSRRTRLSVSGLMRLGRADRQPPRERRLQVESLETRAMLTMDPTSVSITAPATVYERTSFDVVIVASPPGTYMLMGTIDWGDSPGMGNESFSGMTNPAGQLTLSHQYWDDGVGPGNGTASDTETIDLAISTMMMGTLTDSTTTTVANMAPTGNSFALSQSAPVGGATFQLSGMLADAGLSDLLDITIDWGDGSSPTFLCDQSASASISQSHTFPAMNQAYSVAVSVADDDLGTWQWTGTATTPPPIITVLGGGYIAEDDPTAASLTVSRSGVLTSALNVTLSFIPGPGAEANDYELLLNGTPTSHIVTIPAGQSSVALTVKSVDDTKIEYDESFIIAVVTPGGSPTAYTADANSYQATFTIPDNEWRWEAPDPLNIEWNPDAETFIRPGFAHDATLYPHGSILGTNDSATHRSSVTMRSWATATYYSEYQASTTESTLHFECDPANGHVSIQSPVLPDLSDNHEWVSTGLSYEYYIAKPSEVPTGDYSLVTIDVGFSAGVGGSYGSGIYSTLGSGGSGQPDAFEPHPGHENWADEHSESGSQRRVYLACSKGHHYS